MLRQAQFLCVAAALTGCTTHATITRVDGSEFQAKVVGADDAVIRLVNEQQGPGFIERAYVRDIDHPGKAAAIVGTVMTSIGVTVVGGGFAVVDACGGGGFCGLFHLIMTAPGGALALGGLAPMIWGYGVWGRSASAAQQTGTPQGPPALPLSRQMQPPHHLMQAADAAPTAGPSIAF